MRSELTTRHHHGPADHLHEHARMHGAPGWDRAGFAGMGGFGPRGFIPGGPQRKRRGDVRMAILALLSDGQKNGYGLIKEITDRSGATWRPSPGSVYPTLQQLVDEELIEATGEGKRTDFQLTDQGREWIDSHKDALAQIWDSSDARVEAEAGLTQSVAKLMGVVHQLRIAATEEQRAKAIEKLDETRRALYSILAD
jgi:DNA-binding PadR family transcriptional regulator